MMKRLILFLLILGMFMACPGIAPAEAGLTGPENSPEEAGFPVIETDVSSINKYGNLVLSIGRDALMNLGYDFFDIISVSVAGLDLEMPIVPYYTDVDIGGLLCCITWNDETARDEVMLALNMTDFASTMGIAVKTDTEEAPGFRWDCLVPVPLEVTISMKEKNGYADTYQVLHLTRTCDRADYPNLTDEEYANFRNVRTTGMGQLILYRSSSPVDPSLNRNREADEALNNAGVQTVLNLTDSEGTLHGYEGYSSTYYSQRNVIALNMDLNFDKDSFKTKLAEGLTFLAAHEGPYLIHCTEGKDRCGFVSAVLECLMGAAADEVFADYMVSYYDYYGVEPGTDRYRDIMNRYIRKNLETAFEVEDMEQADLALEAEEYLKSAGLSDETIATLRSALSQSFGDSDP